MLRQGRTADRQACPRLSPNLRDRTAGCGGTAFAAGIVRVAVAPNRRGSDRRRPGRAGLPSPPDAPPDGPDGRQAVEDTIRSPAATIVAAGSKRADCKLEILARCSADVAPLTILFRLLPLASTAETGFRGVAPGFRRLECHAMPPQGGQRRLKAARRRLFLPLPTCRRPAHELAQRACTVVRDWLPTFFRQGS